MTGGRNRALTANQAENILYVGTHDGTLAAFRDGETLWKAETVSGPYCRLYLSQDQTRLFAGNESQKVYIFDASNGEMLLEIAVGRNVVDIAVNSDETRIAVVTNTGRNKSNMLIYSADGELLYNNAFQNAVLRGIEYGKDNMLLVANKRGEVMHMRAKRLKPIRAAMMWLQP